MTSHPAEKIREVLEGYERHELPLYTVLEYLETLPDLPGNSTGTVLSATLEGDAHQIGREIASIVFKKAGITGYSEEKLTAETVSRLIGKVNPELIVLSGLLDSVAAEMLEIISRIKAETPSLPVILSGQGLRRHRKAVSRYQNVYMAQSGIQSVRFVLEYLTTGKITSPRSGTEEAFVTPEKKTDRENRELPERLSQADTQRAVPPLPRLPVPPDYAPHTETGFDLPHLWQLINPRTLFNMHLGFRGNWQKKTEADDPEALKLLQRTEAIKIMILENRILTPRAIWQCFRARSAGNNIHILSEKEETIATFTFPRQQGHDRLCLADYIDPVRTDVLTLMVTTIGDGINMHLRNLKEQGRYLDMLILHSIGMQTAEALAEYQHHLLRHMLQGENTSLTPEDAFETRYQGRRYSFGYAACPDMSGQEILFRLLNPEKIGVTLSRIHMMTPEGSVSALLFHHPHATYFTT